MNRTTNAIRLITAVLLGINAGVTLARSVRALVREAAEEEDAARRAATDNVKSTLDDLFKHRPGHTSTSLFQRNVNPTEDR